MNDGVKAALEQMKKGALTDHVVERAAKGAMEKVCQYLGHSSAAVTERVYARFALDHMKNESEILDFTRKNQVQ